MVVVSMTTVNDEPISMKADLSSSLVMRPISRATASTRLAARGLRPFPTVPPFVSTMSMSGLSVSVMAVSAAQNPTSGTP